MGLFIWYSEILNGYKFFFRASYSSVLISGVNFWFVGGTFGSLYLFDWSFGKLEVNNCSRAFQVVLDGMWGWVEFECLSLIIPIFSSVFLSKLILNCRRSGSCTYWRKKRRAVQVDLNGEWGVNGFVNGSQKQFRCQIGVLAPKWFPYYFWRPPKWSCDSQKYLCSSKLEIQIPNHCFQAKKMEH